MLTCYDDQESLWANVLSDIATSINTNANSENKELELVVPTCDKGILDWRKRLSQTTTNLPQNFPIRAFTIGASKMHAQREKVWLVSYEPSKGHDMTLCLMVALLKKVGSFPPMPTAIFPCDCSTTSSAISDMTWRLKRASDILDEGEKDDTAFRLASIFLCSGMIVVTHPNMLCPQDQDTLLAGLGAYFAAESLYASGLIRVHKN